MSLDVELILQALSRRFDAMEARFERALGGPTAARAVPPDGVDAGPEEVTSELPSPLPVTTTFPAAADAAAATATPPEGIDVGREVPLAVRGTSIAADVAAVVDNAGPLTASRLHPGAAALAKDFVHCGSVDIECIDHLSLLPAVLLGDIISLSKCLMQVHNSETTVMPLPASGHYSLHIGQVNSEYISINSSASLCGEVLLHLAIKIPEGFEALVGMTHQCLVMPWLLSATEVDIGPWPPPLKNKNILLSDTIKSYLSSDLSFYYGHDVVKQRPPEPPPLPCCQNFPTDTAQPCLRSWQYFICGLADGQLWQPWPPPMQIEVLSDSIHLRPTPWPSYIGHTTVVQLAKVLSRVFCCSASQHNVKLFFQYISGKCLQHWLEFYVTVVQVVGFIRKEAIAWVQLTQGAIFFISEACKWNGRWFMAVFLQCPFWNVHCASCLHNANDRDFVLWIPWKIPWLFSVMVCWSSDAHDTLVVIKSAHILCQFYSSRFDWGRSDGRVQLRPVPWPPPDWFASSDGKEPVHFGLYDENGRLFCFSCELIEHGTQQKCGDSCMQRKYGAVYGHDHLAILLDLVACNSSGEDSDLTWDPGGLASSLCRQSTAPVLTEIIQTFSSVCTTKCHEHSIINQLLLHLFKLLQLYEKNWQNVDCFKFAKGSFYSYGEKILRVLELSAEQMSNFVTARHKAFSEQSLHRLVDGNLLAARATSALGTQEHTMTVITRAHRGSDLKSVYYYLHNKVFENPVTVSFWSSTAAITFRLTFTAGESINSAMTVIPLWPPPVRIKLLTSIKHLQAPWDPGGIDIMNRLGGKPIFKKGGI